MTIFNICSLYLNLGAECARRDASIEDDETKRRFDEFFGEVTRNRCTNLSSAPQESSDVSATTASDVIVSAEKAKGDLYVESASKSDITKNTNLPHQVIILQVHSSQKNCDDADVLLRLCSSESQSNKFASFGAIFCPPSLIDVAFLDDIDQCNRGNGDEKLCSSSISRRHGKKDNSISITLSTLKPSYTNRLLSLIHPFLATNQDFFPIRGIILSRNNEAISNSANNNEQFSKHQNENYHHPSDIIILGLKDTPRSMIAELIDVLACQQIFHAGPELVMKLVLLSDIVRGSALPVVHVRIAVSDEADGAKTAKESTLTMELPTCPVCLHRLDPSRLGLPKPLDYQLCTRFCPKPVLHWNRSGNLLKVDVLCPRQRLLCPWPSPSYCLSCQVMSDYYDFVFSDQHQPAMDSNSSSATSSNSNHHGRLVTCSYCNMQETLWVCLSCSFVGCGRYSNKHAAQHHNETNHPFCLELSTGRIWSYAGSEYAHRVDLLECPCAPSSIANCIASYWQVQQHQLFRSSQYRKSQFDGKDQIADVTSSGTHASLPATPMSGELEVIAVGPTSVGTFAIGNDHGDSLSYGQDEIKFEFDSSLVASSFTASIPVSSSKYNFNDYNVYNKSNADEKSIPNKTTMIGEEYEALLHSALEEQAHYYEGQISSLRAKLTAEHVDRNSISSDEHQIIELLKIEIQKLRTEIDTVTSKELLDYQGQEAGQRAISQRLLQEQRVTQDLIQKIEEQRVVELEQYQLEIDELEYQIADLTANQKMRHQFELNDELVNAQIQFANTTSVVTSAGTHAAVATPGESVEHSNSMKTPGKKGKGKLRRFFRR